MKGAWLDYVHLQIDGSKMVSAELLRLVLITNAPWWNKKDKRLAVQRNLSHNKHTKSSECPRSPLLARERVLTCVQFFCTNFAQICTYRKFTFEIRKGRFAQTWKKICKMHTLLPTNYWFAKKKMQLFTLFFLHLAHEWLLPGAPHDFALCGDNICHAWSVAGPGAGPAE